MKIFPKKEIETKLKDWYKRKSTSRLRRKSLKNKNTVGTVFDIQPQISSIESVEVFVEVESLMGFALQRKGNLIRPGGYRSSDSFVKDLLPKLEGRFNQQFNKTVTGMPSVQKGVSAHAG